MPVIEHADQLRRRVDEALSASSVSDATVAYKGPAIVWRRAHAVADAIPSSRRGTPTVRALHEVLAIGSASAH